jgi:hypothetical protein
MSEPTNDTLHDRRMDDGDNPLHRCTRDPADRRRCGAPASEDRDGPTRELIFRRDERQGLFWLVAAFVFCPCHLPITFGLLSILGVETARHGYIVLAVVLSAMWAAFTCRGLLLLRTSRTDSTCKRC